MRILQVIHGYPPYYMAGSEVYTYNLARELAKSNEVFVFTFKIHNQIPTCYKVSVQENNSNIAIYIKDNL